MSNLMKNFDENLVGSVVVLWFVKSDFRQFSVSKISKFTAKTI